MSNQLALDLDYELHSSNVGLGQEAVAPRAKFFTDKITVNASDSAIQAPAQGAGSKLVYVDFRGETLQPVRPSNCFVISGTDAALSTKISEIAQRFDILEPQKVSDFLFDYQDLMPFLIEVHAALIPIFSTEKFSLMLIDDPSDVPELVLFVNVAGDAETEMKRLERFQESWWLDNWDRAENRLTVDLQYLC